MTRTSLVANSPIAAYGYVRGLDGIRFLAVLVVIVAHFQIVVPFPGGFGVSIFFFISGFLITRLLLAEEKKHGKIALGRFYLRRFIRLVPPLLLLGIIVVPVLAILIPEGLSWLQITLSFTYLGNLVKPGIQLFGWHEGYPAIDPLWSLAVEEHFYLVLPVLLLLMRGRIARVLIVSSGILVAFVARVLIYNSFPLEAADQINYHFTVTRWDALAFGVLLTLLLDYGWLKVPKQIWVSHLFVVGGVFFMILSILHWSVFYEVVVKYSVQSVAIGVTFIGVLFTPSYSWARSVLEWQPVSHLGKISYELYLWHFPVFTVLLVFLPLTPWSVLLALLGTFGVAEVAYRLTTRRLAGLRRRFGGHPVS